MAPFARETSIASSATLGHRARRRAQAPAPSSSRATAGSEDVCMTDVETVSVDPRMNRRFIVGIDYGTTNSSASYAIVHGDAQELSRSDIHHITNFDSDPFEEDPFSSPSKEVPSVVWYPEEKVRTEDPLSYNSAHERRVRMEIEDQENSESVEEDGEREEGVGANGEHTNHKEKPSYYSREVPENMRWGFEGQPSSTFSNASEFLNARNSPIQWAKLQLADKKYRAGYSKRSQRSFYTLRSASVVRVELDFITDFLTCFFKHIKKELHENEGLQDNEPVEMILCLPVLWPSKARRRMYEAMSIAMKTSGLGANYIDDISMLYEPEAAAAYVLSDGFDMMIDDTFVLLDAGGGTVDAITYKVTHTMPLRLEKEIVEPDGELCGSSFLNDDFRKFIKERLKDETYLNDINGQSNVKLTLDELIEERIVKVFENKVKRKMDFGNSKAVRFVFDVPGLRLDVEKGFYSWKLPVYRDEFLRVFDPRMNQVAAIMERQINKCRENQVDVDKVVLIGGFGNNRALRAHLRARLEQMGPEHGSIIPLKTASDINSSANAVSVGAVLRSFCKELNPPRRLQSSFGLLRKELHDTRLEGHRKGTSVWDKLDGTRYVKNTIWWEFQKGEIVDAQPRVIPTEHTFPIDDPCVIGEHFYVSDILTESHWQTNSTKNKGKYESAGTFTLDLEPWREQGWIKRRSAGRGKHGQDHWAVQFDIVMQIVGCLIRCSARYPSIVSKEPEILKANPVEIPGSRIDMNIVAAFEPGTA